MSQRGHDQSGWRAIQDGVKRAGRFLMTGWRRPVINYSLVALSIIVLGRIILTNRELLLNFEWQLRPLFLLLAVLFFGVDILLGTLAWHLLVRRLGNFDDWRTSTRIIWSANLAHRLPGPAHIASRALQYEQLGVKKRVVSVVSFVELVYFILTGAFFSFLALNEQVLETLALPVDLRLLLGAAAILSLALTHPSLLKKGFTRVQKELYQFDWRDSLALYGLYLLFWAFGGLSLFALLNALTPVEPALLAAVTGFWALANTLSLISQVTIPLAAVRDVSIVFLLSLIVPPPIAIITAVLSRLLWMSGELGTALVSFKM